MASEWARRCGWVSLLSLSLSAFLFWLLSRDEALVSRSPIRWATILLLPALLAVRSLRKKSLDFSGAMLAVLVGVVLSAASACFIAAEVAFFLSSSRLTKWRSKEKEKYEDDFKEGGQRNWVQVVCNGGVALLAALLHLHLAGMGEKPLNLLSTAALDWAALSALGCLAAIACCCGDTWASEVGSVLGGTPKLITTWRKVPRGTNGGVTGVGVVCSFAGGLTIGVTYALTLLIFVGAEGLGRGWGYQLTVVTLYGALCGLFGSAVDSLLGATVQYSGLSHKLGKIVHRPGVGVQHVSGAELLDNHTVNLVSSLVTALVAPAAVWLTHWYVVRGVIITY